MYLAFLGLRPVFLLLLLLLLLLLFLLRHILLRLVVRRHPQSSLNLRCSSGVAYRGPIISHDRNYQVLAWGLGVDEHYRRHARRI